MSLPINPNQITNTTDLCDLVEGDRTGGGFRSGFTHTGSGIDFDPFVLNGEQTSIFNYYKFVGDMRNAIFQDSYEILVSNEEITRRFYLGGVQSNFNPFSCSCAVMEVLYEKQFEDPDYATYVNDGINTLVKNLNDAYTTYILGDAAGTNITNDKNLIDAFNSAMESYVADPTAVNQANLNAQITALNNYAPARNAQFQQYNTAVDTYEAGVATINEAIARFNEKFQNELLLGPFPFLPETLPRFD